MADASGATKRNRNPAPHKFVCAALSTPHNAVSSHPPLGEGQNSLSRILGRGLAANGSNLSPPNTALDPRPASGMLIPRRKLGVSCG